MVEEGARKILPDAAFTRRQDDFETIVQKYGPELTEYINRRIRDFHIAEDLCQEALLRAYKAMSTLESPGRIKSWLYSIAFHVTVDWLRNRAAGKRSPSSLDRRNNVPRAAPGIDEVVIDREERQMIRQQIEKVWRCVKELPPIYREAFELRYRRWRPIAQISQIVGTPEGNVKVRLFRARRMLAKLFERSGSTGPFRDA